MIILPPQAEYCDCIYDFILIILNQKADQSYQDLCADNQQERCQLNECNVVKTFRMPTRLPPPLPLPQEYIPSIDETIINIPIDQGLATVVHPLPTYVHRHPADNDQPIDIQARKYSGIEYRFCLFSSFVEFSNISIEN